MKFIAIALIGALAVPAYAHSSTVLYVARQIVKVWNPEQTYGGTGFYVRTNAHTYLLTAGHVCASNNKGLMRVETGFSSTFTTKILALDKKVDLCLLNSSNTEGLPIATETTCPEPTGTIGYPDLGPMKFAAAPLCDRVFMHLTIPGQSGSPVFNTRGEVVAVIIAKDNRVPVGYVVPLEYVQDFLRGF